MYVMVGCVQRNGNYRTCYQNYLDDRAPSSCIPQLTCVNLIVQPLRIGQLVVHEVFAPLHPHVSLRQELGFLDPVLLAPAVEVSDQSGAQLGPHRHASIDADSSLQGVEATLRVQPASQHGVGLAQDIQCHEHGLVDGRAVGHGGKDQEQHDDCRCSDDHFQFDLPLGQLHARIEFQAGTRPPLDILSAAF